MSKNKIITLKKPGEILENPFTGLLRSGAMKLITDAVKVELQQLLIQYSTLRNKHGHQQIIRNGYLPEREIQTGIGPVTVRVPNPYIS